MISGATLLTWPAEWNHWRQVERFKLRRLALLGRNENLFSFESEK